MTLPVAEAGRARTRRLWQLPMGRDPVPDAQTPTGPVYQTVISGADLKNAYVTTGNTGMSQVVAFELQGDASSKFFQYTSSHLGQPMSIVIDKQVISSPTINGAISNQGIIEGVPPAEVNDLVVQLKAGALAVPLKVDPEPHRGSDARTGLAP